MIPAIPEGILQLPEYQGWLDSVTTNDVDLIKQSLLDHGVNPEHNDENKAKLLLNGTFKFSNTKYIQNHCSGEYKVSKPFFLAAVFGTKEILDVFMELDVDIYQQDKHGNNVIHCLVMVAHLSPELEEHTQNIYHNLVEVLTTNQLHELLMADNKLGLRPLEYACHLATYDLFLTIMDTKDIYLVKQWKEGIHIKCWYDVTDYESACNSRRMFAPLTMLASLDENHLSRESTGRLFKSSLLKSWLATNIEIQKPLLYLHVMIKFIHLCVFICMEMGSFLILPTPNNFDVKQNHTNLQCYDVMTVRFSCNINIALSFILLFYPLYVLINYIHFIITMRACDGSASFHRHVFNIEKQAILSFNTNKIESTCSAIGCIILSCLILSKCLFGHTFNPTMIHLILILTSLTLTWDVLISFHLNETVSQYILIIQRAFNKIVPLAFILAIFISSFTFPFIYLVNDLPNFTCFPGFQSFSDTIYTCQRPCLT